MKVCGRRALNPKYKCCLKQIFQEMNYYGCELLKCIIESNESDDVIIGTSNGLIEIKTDYDNKGILTLNIHYPMTGNEIIVFNDISHEILIELFDWLEEYMEV